ncbi:glycosyltransferase family 2 protein [Nocardia sp. IBHARD005]|uniref:glycosyltransferase family 2 protein n=1 Tax=Nocardia sp. IBHARD005 TaxID=3457765 RepID=UPI0040584907
MPASTGETPSASGADIPGVDVIIPVFDAADHIVDCVASLARLVPRPARVIVVDDCSTDDSGPIAVAALTAAGLPATLVTMPERRGPGTARNRGLAVATAPLVWFVDADDTVAPDMLRILGTALGEHDFAVCRATLVDPTGRVLGIDEPLPPRPVVTGAGYARLLVAGRARAYAPTKLFRRAALSARPWDEVHRYEDLAAMIGVALGAGSVAMVPDAPYHYRRHSGSASQRFDPASFELLRMPRRALDRLAAAGAAPSRAETVAFVLRESVFPLAHLAMRSAPSPDADRAIAAARALVRPAQLLVLAGAGRWRPALAALVLLMFPRRYAQILMRR